MVTASAANAATCQHQLKMGCAFADKNVLTIVTRADEFLQLSLYLTDSIFFFFFCGVRFVKCQVLMVILFHYNSEYCRAPLTCGAETDNTRELGKIQLAVRQEKIAVTQESGETAESV